MLRITIGDTVLLKDAPHGQPGKVLAFSKWKFVVSWPDLGMTTRHRVEKLMKIGREKQA